MNIMSSHSVQVRKARQDDRPRILAISSKIWDGDDYVPELLESWYADTAGELVVAVIDDTVIAFAHRTWVLPGIAWFEGIRTDPAHQGRGAGKAITEYLIRSARDAGATHIHLSTYIDNESSIHIIESYGFQLAATFTYLERPGDLPPPKETREIPQLRPLSEQETIAFVENSDYLSLAGHRFSHGWKFLPFDHDPRAAISPLAYRRGHWESDELKAAVCIRHNPAHGGSFTLNFLDGDPDAMCALLNQALYDYDGKTIEVMVPVQHGRHAAVFELLKEAGFTSWSEFKADVFVYEMVL